MNFVCVIVLFDTPDVGCSLSSVRVILGFSWFHFCALVLQCGDNRYFLLVIKQLEMIALVGHGD